MLSKYKKIADSKINFFDEERESIGLRKYLNQKIDVSSTVDHDWRVLYKLEVSKKMDDLVKENGE